MENVKQRRGLLENAFRSHKWDSKIKSANTTKSEMWLGYVIGPYGMLVMQSIVNSYYNQYLTDVLGFTASKVAWMASFMVMFPLLSKLLDAITNLVMGKLIDRTTCRQGKVRPWLIISVPFLIVSIILLFWMPFSGPTVQAVWVVIAYCLYYCVAFTIWNMAKELTPSLSTRNVNQRKNNALASEITRNVGTGLVSILFPMILTAISALVNGNSAKGYLLTMSLFACISVPLTFVQYFYTRERVTEERRNQVGIRNEAIAAEKTTLREEATMLSQFKTCIKDKYWVLFMFLVFAFNLCGNLRNISLVYYSGWVVRGNAYGEFASIQAKFQMIALSPMGPGILLMLPLMKKMGRRKTIWTTSTLTIIGSIVAFMGAGSSLKIYAGTALAAIGNIAFSYMLMSYMGDVIDHVEWKTGIRCDGITGSFASALLMFSVGIAQGLFNLGLMATKYAQPVKIGVNDLGVALYADQPAAATAWINMSYQGSYILIGAIVFFVFLLVFDIEKKMPQVSRELQERRVAECAALGIEYIPADVLQRLEIEQQEKEAEEIRIKELKEKCAKKGLDFETENQKYLAKKAAKKRKGK
ncbi:MAG: MFS transporter [Sphaerochaetaceae bacterium]|nr:MFS transporter [Sphaerochaetaceae bacterium]